MVIGDVTRTPESPTNELIEYFFASIKHYYGKDSVEVDVHLEAERYCGG